jgi:hypothetical protein
MNRGARHASAKMTDFPRPVCLSVGRQTPQLCMRKVSHNEARRPSCTFGKDELNLGIGQFAFNAEDRAEPSRRGGHDVGARACMRRHGRPALRVQFLKQIAGRSTSR